MNPLDVKKVTVFLGMLIFLVPVLTFSGFWSRWIRQGLFLALIWIPATSYVHTGCVAFSLHAAVRTDGGYNGWGQGVYLGLVDCVALALLGIVFLHRNSEPRVGLRIPGFWIWGLFVLFVSIGLLDAANKTYSLIAFMLLPKLTLHFLAMFFYLRKYREFRLAAIGLAAVAATVGLVSLHQRYIQGFNGCPGWMPHRNVNGTMGYLVGIPTFAFAIYRGMSAKWLVILVACAGLGVIGCILTISRAAYFCGIVGMASSAILCLIFLKPDRTRSYMLLAAGACGAVVIWMSSDTIMDRFSYEAERDKLSTVTDLRWVLNETAKVIYRDHQWTGVGIGNFALVASAPWPKYSSVFANYYHARVPERYRRPVANVPNVESVYFTYLPETGLPATSFLVLWMVLLPFWGITNWWVLRRNEFGWTNLGIAITGGLVVWHATVERVVATQVNAASIYISLFAIVCASRVDVRALRKNFKRTGREIEAERDLPFDSAERIYTKAESL